MSPPEPLPEVLPPADPALTPAPAGVSPEQPRWHRWMPRPPEWVLLAFFLYVTVLLLWPGGPPLPEMEAHSLNRLELVAALLAVAVVKLGRRYAQVPWPAGTRGLARLHWGMLLFFLIPAALVVNAQLQTGFGWIPRGYVNGTPLTVPFLAASPVLRFVLLYSLPPVALWLALGLHTKAHGGLRAWLFIRETASSTLDNARDWLPPTLIVLAYTYLGVVLDRHYRPDQDDFLAHWDAVLFLGHNPVAALQSVIWWPLSEWLAFVYSFYVLLFPLCFGAVYARGGRHALRELSFAITLCFSVGLATFVWMPAMGPLFTQHFEVSLDLYYMRYIKEELMEGARVPRDCFPSMHTALTALFAWGMWRHGGRGFWWLLPIAVSIPFSCVYFRYHYVLDVISGLALAALIAWFTPRLIAAHERWAELPG